MGKAVKGLFSGGAPQAAGAEIFTSEQRAPFTQRLIENASIARFGEDIGLLRDQLQAQALGEGPSVARQQLQTATERNLAETLGAAASGRAQNTALAQREAQRQRAGASQLAARQSSELRAQEQLAARQQLGDLVTSARQQEFQIQEADRQARQRLALANQQAALATQGANLQQQGAERGRQAQLGKDVIGGAAQAASFALSDETTKEDVKDIKESDLKSFAKAVAAKSFKFKEDPDKNENVGVVAQDLEKSSLGKKLIDVVDGKKGINLSRATQANLAMNAELMKRIFKLESQKKGPDSSKTSEETASETKEAKAE